MKSVKAKILQGDCKNKLKEIDSNSIDLIITSPPYADRRKNTYGGIKPDEYVDWFLPISEQLLRVLKFLSWQMAKSFPRFVGKIITV